MLNHYSLFAELRKNYNFMHAYNAARLERAKTSPTLACQEHQSTETREVNRTSPTFACHEHRSTVTTRSEPVSRRLRSTPHGKLYNSNGNQAPTHRVRVVSCSPPHHFYDCGAVLDKTNDSRSYFITLPYGPLLQEGHHKHRIPLYTDVRLTASKRKSTVQTNTQICTTTPFYGGRLKRRRRGGRQITQREITTVPQRRNAQQTAPAPSLITQRNRNKETTKTGCRRRCAVQQRERSQISEPAAHLVEDALALV